MACCLMAPSHYLNQCWLITSKVLWHSSEGNFIRDTSATIHQSQLENYLPEIKLKSPRGQWVNGTWPVWHQATIWANSDLFNAHWILTNKIPWELTKKEKCPVKKTILKIVVCKMVAMLSLLQCSKHDRNSLGIYRQVSNIRRTLVGNQIVDHSYVVGASPVGAAPTTSSFST